MAVKWDIGVLSWTCSTHCLTRHAFRATGQIIYVYDYYASHFSETHLLGQGHSILWNWPHLEPVYFCPDMDQATALSFSSSFSYCHSLSHP
jgi:hypothetical protein